jgi:anthraniloyl-CoA monooxygenase
MKVIIVGGGAAGLSTAIAVRTVFKSADITILERAREDDTPGLGVALLPYALQMISLQNFPAYKDSFLPISRVTEVFAGPTKAGDVIRETRVQDVVYSGVKRATLLTFLREGAKNAGARVEYEADVSEERVRTEQASCDLLVGADGAGSVVRTAFAEQFVPRGRDAKSRFAWLELAGPPLDHFLFGYIYVAGKGLIRVTAYPYARQQATAIVTHSVGWTSYLDEPGMVDGDGVIADRGMNELNSVFSLGLGSRRLDGTARWRRFKATHCERAAFANVALVGDAYATLFYETGWGTSVAIQESSMLGHALLNTKSLQAGLEIYNTKCTELSAGAVTATAKTMREIDGQSAKFFQLGPAKFLKSGAA